MRNNSRSQSGILFDELDDAVVELAEVEAQVTGFVEGKERFFQENFVFFLQRQGEAIDDATK